jgi:restriction system protein
LKNEFAEGDAKAVEFFCSEVLNHSSYPDNFPQDSTISFNQSNRVLVVDFELPNQSALPKIKEVKYIAVRNQLQEVPMPETWMKRTYDDVLYQVALRTLHELFVADEFNIVKSIVLTAGFAALIRPRESILTAAFSPCKQSARSFFRST